MSDTILDVHGLSVQFCKGPRVINAVDDVSFQVKRGQTLGIVGESGSGKSVTSLAIMGLVPSPPGQITQGDIWFYEPQDAHNDSAHNGSQAHGANPAPGTSTTWTHVNLRELSPSVMQQYRGEKISMIFQEPMSSLNPVYTCGYQIVEAIRQHTPVSKAEAEIRAMDLLQEVKLLPSDEALREEYMGIWRRQQSFPPSSYSSGGMGQTGATGVLTRPASNGSSSAADAHPSERTDSKDRNQAKSVDGSGVEFNGNGNGNGNGRDPLQPPAAKVEAYVQQQKRRILNRYPHELSGGQLQRVMIAMAISCNPSLLIADEPTTALDVTVQAMILDLLRELRDRRGMGMIFITHDLSIIAEIADRVAVMYQGKIVESGSVTQIFSDPNHAYTKGLLTCRPRPDQRLKCLPTVADFMEVVNTPEGKTVISEKSQSVDRVLDTHAMVSAADMSQRLEQLQTQEPLLSVRDLQVGFPIKGVFGRLDRYMMAVNGVSFDVYPGETLGLVGESGCGKSTLASTLLQLIKPMGGQITFDGRDLSKLRPRELRSLRKEMQIIFQDPFSSLDPRMSVGEAILEPLNIHKQGGSRRQQRLRVAELMERVGLSPGCIDRFPHEFSGGQRQRVCIARALALNPKFIICDESVSALDVSVQAQVLNLLKGLQEEFGLTYIFISHDLSVVKFMSDRIMVMNKGKIEEMGPADAIYNHPQRPYTQDLIQAIPKGTLEQIEFRQAQRKQALAAS